MQNDNYLQTKAIIFDNEKEGNVYIPILKYEVDDVTYEVRGEPAEIAAALDTEIVISYNPENPKEFTIDDTGKSVMFILIGILVFLCGIYVFYSTVKYLNFNAENLITVEDDQMYQEKEDNLFKASNKEIVNTNSKTDYDDIEILII